LARGTAFIADITHYAQDWQRSIRAIGGFWKGSFYIPSGDGPGALDTVWLREFFYYNMGRRVEEKTHGVVSWEGEIVQMDLTHRGITYRRTLDPERWHNKVKVAYTNYADSVAAATAWSENTDSSDVYGESGYIDLVGKNHDSTSAAALRDRRLIENAWPRGVPVGGLAFGGFARNAPDGLEVVCAGYVFSVNRRYRESDTAAAAVSSQISTLIGESEFVTAGRIDTNSLSVPIAGSEIPFRLWDGIEDYIGMGDGSGNRWVGGVYDGREMHYKAAETAVTHYWTNGQLTSKDTVRVTPTLIQPDIIVRLTETPLSLLPAGGGDWDDMRNVYIEEVEFVAPDAYRLLPYGGMGVMAGGAR
jgi:hypothetical protein